MDVLSLIFPKKCLECNKEGAYICGECLNKVKTVGWHNSNTYSVWKYEGVIRKAIIALKYKYATEIAEAIVGNINPKIIPGKYCLVPIPLYWYRKNFRGFNQAEALGEKLAKKMGWKYTPYFLIRTRSTPPQAELTKSQRLENLRDVFAVNPKVKLTKNSKIILFDDVFTTGSTLNEATKTLKESGFSRIWGLTVAR